MFRYFDHCLALAFRLVIKLDKNGDRHNESSENAKYGDDFPNHDDRPVSVKCNAKET